MPNDSKPKPTLPQSPITNKTIVVEVRDTVFAAALYSVDIPFVDPKNPCTVFQFADGTRKITWRFQPTSRDGKLNTQKLLQAAADPVEWTKANSEHAFAYALVSALNVCHFLDYFTQRRALVGFKLKGDRTIYVFDGSRKCKRLREMGAVQI